MNHSDIQSMIERFVKADRIIWPRDMKIAKALSKEMPEKEFWLSYLIIKYELASLNPLKSGGYKDYVKEQYKMFKEKAVIVEKEKVREPVEKVDAPEPRERKATNLKEFLD